MIQIKKETDIAAMKEGGAILSSLLRELTFRVEPGTTTWDLDQFAYTYIRDNGGIPSFLNYNGFPASTCISLNEVVLHGIPRRDQVIAAGDVVSIDCGIFFKGFHTDAARTVIAGNKLTDNSRLVRITEEACNEGIKKAREGNRVGDISAAIEKHVAAHGFVVIREYVGHGIGRNLHEEPSIPNYGKAGSGAMLKKGMTLAVEVMVLCKSNRIGHKADGWGVYATNGLPTSHHENTIVITSDGPDYITYQ